MIKNIIFDLGNVLLKGSPLIVLENSKLKSNEYYNLRKFFENWKELDLGKETLEDHIKQCRFDITLDKEKENLINDLSAELSSEQEDIKYFNIARAVDISPLQEYLSEIIGTTDNAIQKRLLKTHLKEVQRMSLNGEIVERQSFIMINSKRTDNCEKDLLKRCMELSNKFERCDIKTEILDEASLIQLCNSFLNMNYAYREDSDIEDKVVMLK